MHRDKLLRLLADYAARHPAEDSSRFQAFVERQPRCFERDCFDDGHVTGSAVLLDGTDPRRAAMLMTHHAKLGKWLQLGGHADGDTDPLAVACREAAEESGLEVSPLLAEPIDLDIHAIPARGSDPPHYHYDVRFALHGSERAATVSEESLALKWVPLTDIESVTREESILRMVAKCRAALDGLRR